MSAHIHIIGGGISGLVAAIASARSGCAVTIWEQKEKIGQKILVTGNGKCNYTNNDMSVKFYHSSDNELVEKILSCFDNNDLVKFFRTIGIEPLERNGYIYPHSEQASSVLNALRREVDRLGIKIMYKAFLSISKDKSSYIITDKGHKEIADKIILATGSIANQNIDRQYKNNLISDIEKITKANIKYHNFLPALCPLIVSDSSFLNTAAGVRAKAKASLLIDDKYISSEIGEIQINKTGLSGIPIMNLSSDAIKAYSKNKDVHIRLNFCNDIDKKIIYKRFTSDIYDDAESIGIGLINKNLWYAILKKSDISIRKIAKDCDLNDIDRIINNIYDCDFEISDIPSYDKAQVCSGGIDMNEIDNNMMLKKCHNIYAVGELLDVDGICGGYNIQWACASGYIAGSSAGGDDI